MTFAAFPKEILTTHEVSNVLKEPNSFRMRWPEEIVFLYKIFDNETKEHIYWYTEYSLNKEQINKTKIYYSWTLKQAFTVSKKYISMITLHFQENLKLLQQSSKRVHSHKLFYTVATKSYDEINKNDERFYYWSNDPQQLEDFSNKVLQNCKNQ